ncbi:uncharacterized protein LOC130135850 [Syzygium oleosum]|uniref:uncharacterized protein LOC130135850 n=1 Tax=Syzygium oleosum TaxID=219896 RepID=UPI0024BAA9AA|nr:uncharacterized protein LOC130135850 [Syzygium oleosum]
MKDQVLHTFKDLHVKLERETGRKLKCVRADNDGKYRGPFEDYCRVHGIRLEKTVPKTLQHNGIAKKMNRTICERIRKYEEPQSVEEDLVELEALDSSKNSIGGGAQKEVKNDLAKQAQIKTVTNDKATEEVDAETDIKMVAMMERKLKKKEKPKLMMRLGRKQLMLMIFLKSSHGDQ